MGQKYILSIDQSTQGTKALLFDRNGVLTARTDIPHQQIVNEYGWVSHNLNEIYRNTVQAVKNLVEKTGVSRGDILGLGISNQRETAAVWSRSSGEPVADAIVWQCSRAKDVCSAIEQLGHAELVREKTGINLSPYFPASKFAWILQNIEAAKLHRNDMMFGTIDTWLIYKLTKHVMYKTDYSNASRTQLYDISRLKWSEEVCGLFGIDMSELAEVCDSNDVFGETDFDGYFEHPIPIAGVLGDSHGALFGQGCLTKGMIKTTFGTGSSVMMNIGETPIFSKHGVVTSLAWGMDGKVNYVLEGNINYTGAVITWLQNDVKAIGSAKETESLAFSANPEDTTYLVPAFTGLGAPYWHSTAKAMICGISRTTGQAELAKAALECIAYQITDVIEAMRQDAGIEIKELRVDGGPTRNGYLMQFQSDMACIPVLVPDAEELSGIGAAYMAGISLGLYDKKVFDVINRKMYRPEMSAGLRQMKYRGWKEAIRLVIQ